MTVTKEWLADMMQSELSCEIPDKHSIFNVYRRIRGEIAVDGRGSHQARTNAESWSTSFKTALSYGTSMSNVRYWPAGMRDSGSGMAATVILKANADAPGNRHSFIDLKPLYDATELNVEKHINEVTHFGSGMGPPATDFNQVVIPYGTLEKNFGQFIEDINIHRTQKPKEWQQFLDGLDNSDRAFIEALVCGRIKPMQFEGRQERYDKILLENDISKIIREHSLDFWVIDIDRSN